jgi:DNA-binding MarR family transcriptional regulator
MDTDRTTAHRTLLYHRLQMAARRAQRAADRELLAAAGVTTAQAAVLAVLAARGSLTQRAIAETLGLHESAVAQMVPRLLKLELVTRAHPAGDARAWELALTEAGRAAVARVGRAFGPVNATFEGALPAARIEQLAADLERIADAFVPHSPAG